MRIDRYIAISRIIDLKSANFEGAITELLEVCDFSKVKGLRKELLLGELLEREKQMTTYLGEGICLPHSRVAMKRPYMIAVGRCPGGLRYDGRREYQEIRYVFLLLAAKNVSSYLYSLASLARVFRDNSHMERLKSARELSDFRRELKQVFGGEAGKPRRRHNRFNNLILKETAKIAKGANCTTILIFGDTFGGGVEVGDAFKDFKTVLIAQGTSEAVTEREEIDAVIAVRSFSNRRFSQLRSAVLIGLTRGIFASGDRICCVGGLPQSNQFDSITVVDIERELQSVFMTKTDMLPASVKPEVIERVLAIATELAVKAVRAARSAAFSRSAMPRKSPNSPSPSFSIHSLDTKTKTATSSTPSWTRPSRSSPPLTAPSLSEAMASFCLPAPSCMRQTTLTIYPAG